MKQAKLALLYRDVVSDAKLINSMPALGATPARLRLRTPGGPLPRAATPAHPASQVLATADRVSLQTAVLPHARWAGSAYTRTKLVDAGDWSLSLICWAPGADRRSTTTSS